MLMRGVLARKAIWRVRPTVALVVRIRVFAPVAKLKRKTQVSGLLDLIRLWGVVVEEVARKLKGVKNVIIVLSGKGGVGKSTVAT